MSHPYTAHAGQQQHHHAHMPPSTDNHGGANGGYYVTAAMNGTGGQPAYDHQGAGFQPPVGLDLSLQTVRSGEEQHLGPESVSAYSHPSGTFRSLKSAPAGRSTRSSTGIPTDKLEGKLLQLERRSKSLTGSIGRRGRGGSRSGSPRPSLAQRPKG